MNKFQFKKIGENCEGFIVEVSRFGGGKIGTIRKWKGLFIPCDSRINDEFLPRKTRTEAAEVLDEIFELERELTDSR